MNFSLWVFQRFKMQTGSREMKAQVDDQKNQKKSNRIKDSRIRHLRRTFRVKESRIRVV